MAVFIYSGGLDSAAALTWGLSHGLEGPHVALSFRYGQRNAVELQYAKRSLRAITKRFDAEVDHCVVNIAAGMRALCDSDLLRAKGKFRYNPNQIPGTYVPARNLVFMSLAASKAISLGIREVVVGLGKDDCHMPDCRSKFLALLAATMHEGAKGVCDIRLLRPLKRYSKPQLFALMDRHGLLDMAIRDTLTCLYGKETLRPWGRGCTECGPCEFRAEAFADFEERRA